MSIHNAATASFLASFLAWPLAWLAAPVPQMCIPSVDVMTGPVNALMFRGYILAETVLMLPVRLIALVGVTLINLRVLALEWLFNVDMGNPSENGLLGLLLGYIGPLAIVAIVIAILVYALHQFATWTGAANPIGFQRVFVVTAGLVILVQSGESLAMFYENVRSAFASSSYTMMRDISGGDAGSINGWYEETGNSGPAFAVPNLTGGPVSNLLNVSAGMVYIANTGDLSSLTLLPQGYIANFHHALASGPAGPADILTPDIVSTMTCSDSAEIAALSENLQSGIARIISAGPVAWVGLQEQIVWTILMLGSVIVVFGVAMSIVPAFFQQFDAIFWTMLRVGLVVIIVSFGISGLMGIVGGLVNSVLVLGSGDPFARNIAFGVILLAGLAYSFLGKQAADTMGEAFKTAGASVSTSITPISQALTAVDAKTQADELARLRGEKESQVEGGMVAGIDDMGRRFQGSMRVSEQAGAFGRWGGPGAQAVLAGAGAMVGAVNPDFDATRMMSSAVQGASTGASVGGFVPGIGTAAGAVAGAVLLGGAEATGVGRDDMEDAKSAMQSIQRGIHAYNDISGKVEAQQAKAQERKFDNAALDAFDSDQPADEIIRRIVGRTRMVECAARSMVDLGEIARKEFSLDKEQFAELVKALSGKNAGEDAFEVVINAYSANNAEQIKAMTPEERARLNQELIGKFMTMMTTGQRVAAFRSEFVAGNVDADIRAKEAAMKRTLEARMLLMGMTPPAEFSDPATSTPPAGAPMSDIDPVAAAPTNAPPPAPRARQSASDTPTNAPEPPEFPDYEWMNADIPADDVSAPAPARPPVTNAPRRRQAFSTPPQAQPTTPVKPDAQAQVDIESSPLPTKTRTAPSRPPRRATSPAPTPVVTPRAGVGGGTPQSPTTPPITESSAWMQVETPVEAKPRRRVLAEGDDEAPTSAVSRMRGNTQ